MSEFITGLSGEFQQNTWLELTAVILGVLYLLLAVKENILCWYAAFLSTAIFLYVFWSVQLYMESALQVYYLGMAVFGWFQWRGGSGEPASLPISRWPWQRHLWVLVAVTLASVFSGLMLAEWTDAQLPFADSFTTFGALVATYMVTKKVLENWLYWLVIDAINVFLYLDRGLYFTALLFMSYLVIVLIGWFSWSQSLKTSST